MAARAQCIPVYQYQGEVIIEMSSARGVGGRARSWAAAWKRGCVARLKGQTLTKIRERLHQGEIEMTARGERGNYSHFMVPQLGDRTKRNDENNPT